MKSSLHFTFIFLFLINIIDGNRWRSDYTYVRRAKGYFKFHEIPAIWKDARLRCQLEGAVLASPYPQEVNETLLELMTAIHKEHPLKIFTGIHATFSSGDYYTVTGTPLRKIPIKWMASEPDNKNNEEKCLIINSQGLAADTNCSDTHPYFCYHEKNDNEIFLDQCGTPDHAYEYNAATQSCYKFHTVPRTWSRAYMACSAEGAHLAIINSDAEAEIMKTLFAKHPANSILGTFWKDGAFIGFHSINQGGDWITVHGETIKSAGYTKFSPGQPDNATAGEYCGCVFRSGLLNDLWCENSYVFICEKKPNNLIFDDDEY